MSVSPLNLDTIRHETHGIESYRTHLNAAGSALKPWSVKEAEDAYRQDQINHGDNGAAVMHETDFADAYEVAGRTFGCNPKTEVAFMPSATDAWLHAFHALRSFLKPGDRILTSNEEYGTNEHTYEQFRQELGIEIVQIPTDEFGQISIPELEHLIDPRVKIISVTHANTDNPMVQPAAEIGKIAHANGIIFVLDAAQTGGVVPLKKNEIHYSVLTAPARKGFRGSEAVAVLVIDENLA